MKSKILNTLLILIASCLSVMAQDEDKKIKIKVIEEVNGERTVVERVYNSREEMMNDMELKSMNIEFLENEDGFKFNSKDGEHIIIKDLHEKQDGEEDKKVHIFFSDDEDTGLHMLSDGDFEFKSLDDGEDTEFTVGENTFEIRKGDDGKVVIIKDGEAIEADFELNEDAADENKNVFIFKSGSKEKGMHVIREVKVKKIHVEDISKKDPDLEEVALDNRKNLNLDGLSYFPNPNEGVLNLNFRADAKATEVKITDINGQVIHQDMMPSFEGVYDKAIDLSSQPSGIYILQIIQGNRAINKKLVIE